MKTDAVDDILEQWSEERPELETESLGVVIRIMSLSRAFSSCSSTMSYQLYVARGVPSGCRLRGLPKRPASAAAR
jgi:hypothetical protein